MNENITRRSLVVNLTEQEITDFSKELARITTLQAEIEEEKKTVTSSYKEKLDRCISDSRSLARKISTRQDYREVECEWKFDCNRRMKTLFRTDTWAQIEERKLTSDELQAELDFGGPAQEEHPPGCPKCDGDGEYYEDGIEDGGRQVYCDCPAGVALKEKDKTIIVESKSICATCLGDCKPEEQDPEILNGLTYCADFRDAPSPKQEAARDYTCNDWRECNHAFKCFGPANDDSGLCFKQIEEAREADQEEPAEICTHCNGSGEREENGRMVYCDWCPAGDALQEKELLEAKAKAPEPTGSRCPLCDFVGYSKAELIKHVRATHKTSLKEAMDAASKALPNVDHDNDGWPDPPTAGAAA